MHAQLSDCIYLTAAKLRDTPCHDIRVAYSECLAGKGRVACKSIKSQLEACTAKHLGKLD